MTRSKSDFNLDMGSMSSESEVSLLPTLTMAEMKEIEAQAQAEVAAELKANLRKDFLARTKAELKKQVLFKAGTDEKGEVLERILIDLPKFAADIRLDGIIYSHRHSYVFGQARAAVI